MRRLGAIRAAFFGALIACAWQAAPAQGAFIASETSSVTRLNASTYFYSYTVTVAATSTVSASEFDLSLGASIDLNSIVSPSNFFTFYTPGDPFISFTAYDNGTPFLGITPGSSGTFSFTSSAGAGQNSFSVQGLDPSFTLDSVTGTALTPGAVPEPASVVLTTLGLGALLGGSIRARRRAGVAPGSAGLRRI